MGELKLRVCAAHGVATRLDCASCGEPICLRCQVETDNGFACPRCAATPATASPRSRVPALTAAVVGVVLVVGAVVAFRAAVSPSGRSSGSPGQWQELPNLSVVRGPTTAVALRDGRVLVAGGGIGAIPLAGTEVYDPVTRAWSRSGDMVQARRGHAAVLLSDGRVLVAGGLAGDRVLSSAEVYDPSSGSWAATAPMHDARFSHTLSALPDGRVLAAGGSGAQGAALASAEVYDPRTGTWTTIGTGMSLARSNAAAVALADGRIVIVGGTGGNGGQPSSLDSAELFDPVADVFTRTGDLHQGRQDLSATRLADGRVLVVGGSDGLRTLQSAEIFDPRRGTWTETVPMGTDRRLHGATLLPDGRVLVSGGESVRSGSRAALATAEVFDPATSRWRQGPPMECPRSGAAQATLRDGGVLVVGGDAAFPGQPPSAQSCTEVFAPFGPSGPGKP